MFWKLLISEFKHPRVDLALSLAAVVLSVGCVISSFLIMSFYDVSTERSHAAKIAAHSALVNTGKNTSPAETFFDALIIPNDMNVSDVKMGAVAIDVISRSSVDLLAASEAGLARAIIPALERRIRWREENCVVILCGMDGVNSNREANSGTVVMGAVLAETLSFSVGDKFLMNGESCTVGAVRPERGDIGDITIWISLDRAQKLLKMPGKVNGVFAFGCSDFDALAVSTCRVLPNSKILIFSSTQNSQTASMRMLNEKFNSLIRRFLVEHLKYRGRLEINLAICCVLVITMCAGCFFLITVSQQKQKAEEIAMMLSYGVSSNLLLALNMLRACIVLLLGISIAVLMVGVTFSCYVYFNGVGLSWDSFGGVFAAKLAIWTLLLTLAVGLAATYSASLRTKHALVIY